MFTGIIEEIGVVERVEKLPKGLPAEAGRRFFVAFRKLLPRVPLGGSLAVNGCCLTAARRTARGVFMDVASETLKKTTLGEFTKGRRVHLEAPLRHGDPLGGHFVQGHVDAAGKVLKRWREGRSLYLRVSFPGKLAQFLVPTGSVALDGVSLTVADLGKASFDVCLIPHTLRATALGALREGSRVNLEMDVLGKYAARMRGAGRKSEPPARRKLPRPPEVVIGRCLP
jgi:riboflavin synthase